jgi:hypothetical protein
MKRIFDFLPNDHVYHDPKLSLGGDEIGWSIRLLDRKQPKASRPVNHSPFAAI